MRSYPEVKKAIGASEESFEILDRKPVVPPEGHLNPENLEGRIEFKNVKFSYSGKTDENNFLLNVRSYLPCLYSVYILSDSFQYDTDVIPFPH